jgi:hypothetical protein
MVKLPWARQNWRSFITLTMDRSWFNSRREDASTKNTLHRIRQRWTAAALLGLRRIRQEELIAVQWTSKQYFNFILAVLDMQNGWRTKCSYGARLGTI